MNGIVLAAGAEVLGGSADVVESGRGVVESLSNACLKDSSSILCTGRESVVVVLALHDRGRLVVVIF